KLTTERTCRSARRRADHITAPGENASEIDENEGKGSLQTPEWTSMMRRGSNSARADRPGMFFPIYVDPAGPQIVHIGEPLPQGESEAPELEGLTAVLPIRRNGDEGRWQVSPGELRSRLEQGRVRLGRQTNYGYVINYLPDGAYAAVLSDQFSITGRAADGSLVAVGARDTRRVAPTQWKVASHNASEQGTGLLSQFLPDRKFPFPKSLYAVEDALRFFVESKPDALVLDFFAGSGTTAHAVMRLNRQDGGRRRSICVTNNEVGPAEQAALRARGLNPGDEKWEALGICDYITKPRIRAAITGTASTGSAVEGDYRFADEFPMADGFQENAEFFTLTYEEPALVSLGRRFEAIAPLLWLRAGARGQRIGEVSLEGWSIPATACYGVLFDTSAWGAFVAAASSREDLTHAFIVTDSLVEYQQIVSRLSPALATTRLYADYLRSFEINVRTT
ncbi:DNA methyltransferase, partial [Oerskovia merdavium]